MRRWASAAPLLDGAVRRGWLTPRAAGAVRIAGVPVLVLGALVWLVVSVFRAGGAGDPRPLATFADPSSGSYVDVQLNSALKSYGAFSAVVAGQGRVWPTQRVQVTPGADGEVELRYDGTGRRDPQVQPGVPDERTGPRPRGEVVRLRLLGRVDTVAQRASVDVWVNGTRHRIVSTGQPGGADDVVNDFLVAVRTANWNQLYEIESSFMRNGNRRSKFVTEMTHAGVVNTVSGARAIGPTSYTMYAGAVQARAPIRLTYGAGAETTKVDATLVLAVEAGAWRVLAVE